jgi:hypothetical protein
MHFVAVTAAAALPGASAFAANSTWTGTGDGNWNDATKWSAGVPNAVGDRATFGWFNGDFNYEASAAVTTTVQSTSISRRARRSPTDALLPVAT